VETDAPTAGIENEDGEEDEDGSVELEDVMIGPQLPEPAPVVFSDALIDKLRANAFEGRRKAMDTQRVDEQKLFPLMWSRNPRFERNQDSRHAASDWTGAT
jgi:hypothetical protein